MFILVPGTGHGVGAALNVHEGPQSISYRYGNLTALQKGMVVSNEPGYYEDNSFGIRIEVDHCTVLELQVDIFIPNLFCSTLQNLLLIKELNLANSFGGISYLGFEKLTFVPIQVQTNILGPCFNGWNFTLVTYISNCCTGVLFLFD